MLAAEVTVRQQTTLVVEAVQVFLVPVGMAV
jgi:hypothetical protein